IGALDAFKTAIKLKPDYAGAYYNIGNALLGNRQMDEAVSNYRHALEIEPDYAEVHCALGVALKQLGKTDSAIKSFLKAKEINPGLTEVQTNLDIAMHDIFNVSNTMLANGQFDDAVASYQRVLDIKSDYAEAHAVIGMALKELGKLDAAVVSYQRALRIKPDLAEVHSNLGNALQDLGQLENAVESYRRALALKPDFMEAHSNLGNALQGLGQLENAVESYRRALALKPNFVEAHNNLGLALKDLGKLESAIDSYRQALELKPDFAEAYSNLLFALNYTANHASSYYLEQARQYGRIVAAKVDARFSSWQCAARPERLRVGLVSGDLLNHPVGYFLEALLTHIDPARIELIAYSTVFTEDELTKRIRPLFSTWKTLTGLSDEAAANLIHSDGSHILIDLSGHTGHNRLPVFAWKPAPVQVSWLGYFATTGVAEMDYLLADVVSVPEVLQAQFTESICYLPDTRLCLTAPGIELAVTPLPALQNSYITFGCFQNLAKVNEDVLAVWGKILAALPNTKLRMQCKLFGEPTQVEQFFQRLQRYNIDPARVTMHGSTQRQAYLAVHADVDMILDTFPYPGGTTTCEALWMGVPTLTLAGDSLLARQGASLLTAARLEEWIASSKEEYILKAISFASDLSTLATLRAGLRQQIEASPLFDAPRFARNFEKALWKMWQNYQAQ
ncbi:MAG: tetratricopeptide repeat protein, partial [Gallionella sp.]